jgi:hypothetical protein
MQNSLLNMREEANGALIFPEDSRRQPPSPLTCSSDHDIPDELVDALMKPTYRNLSTVDNLKIIRTAFDEERLENIKVKYSPSNKKARFRYTTKQRSLAEAASICYSIEDFETKVSVLGYIFHSLICHF